MAAIVFNLSSKVFRYLLFLAFTGQLIGATIDLQKKAHNSVRHGLISLQAINQQLMPPEK